MKNKFVIALALFLGLIFIVSSCDTRDDYFYEHCDEPVVNFISDSDTIVDESTKYIIVDVNWGHETEISYSFTDEYGEITNVSYDHRGGSSSYYYFDKETETFRSDRLEFDFDNQNQKIYIKELTKDAKDVYNSLKEENPDLYLKISKWRYEEFRVAIMAKNILGKTGTGYILLRVHFNQKPQFDITIDDTENDLEKVIIVTPTGSEDDIIYYEYCIDGSTAYTSGYVFENGYESGDAEKIKAGEAAWNGTYITATTLSMIRHAFQYSGKHTISVRCQDIWGCWSEWEKKKITIN